ncbi:helix-turn-helix domain-containing protein [Siminovitchia sp. 179-K 8D1 HS]|uniref:helix-turn-helix domain-containing protein n=1 Tax=Siminovitchia sp. 179-K 8D1 HS TaxID=3142385 RepID=UPI0039A213D0
MEFSKYLKKLREENKLSIRQLALYSNVSPAYLSQIENGSRGTPSPEVLKKLYKPLKVPYENLLRAAGYIDEEKKDPYNTNFNPLSEINELVEKYGIEQMGFFDIEEWKNLSPEDVRLIEEHFKMIVKLAKERNKKK